MNANYKSSIATWLWQGFSVVFILAFVTSVSAQTPTLRANGKIAFTSDRDGNREIYVMNADGTNHVRLTDNSVVDDHPTWSPDGTKIAFVSERTNGGRAIFTMNADGTDRTEVTPVSYLDQYPYWPYFIWTDFFSMDWSPDCTQIVFQDNYDIVIVNADGSHRHAITDGTSYDLEPAWSPDGSKIVFSRDPINDGGLQYGRLSTMNTDGSNIQFLPNAFQGQEYAPKWSPLGDKILFVIEFTDDIPDSVIYTTNADGSNDQLFDGNSSGYEYRNKPSWSPNGSKILFDKWVYEPGVMGDLEIYVKKIDGAESERLTNTSGWNFNPSWQPLAAVTCSNPNPIDCADFFVGQQYRDFLNREPEREGLQFYLNLLNRCAPTDAECTRYMRGLLSANFFRSPEFGRKGSYVMYLYLVSIGQRPVTVAELATKNDPNLNDRPHYSEFLTDLTSISTPNDDPALTEAKKDALAVDWVNRAQIQSLYPASLSNAQFAQRLADNAGVVLSSATQAAIANAQTRAQILRIIVESPEVDARFFKESFVTMEYFGYLRRDPEDCHNPANWGGSDPSQCGFIFHNNRFNLHPDPAVMQNIIVRGFIESPEYRARF